MNHYANINHDFYVFSSIFNSTLEPFIDVMNCSGCHASVLELRLND